MYHFSHDQINIDELHKQLWNFKKIEILKALKYEDDADDSEVSGIELDDRIKVAQTLQCDSGYNIESEVIFWVNNQKRSKGRRFDNELLRILVHHLLTHRPQCIFPEKARVPNT
jgi:hypothetical protein